MTDPQRHWIVPPKPEVRARIEASDSDRPPDDLELMSFQHCRAAFSEMDEDLLEEFASFFEEPTLSLDAGEITFGFGEEGSTTPNMFLRARPRTVMTALLAEQVERAEDFERLVNDLLADPVAVCTTLDRERLFRFAFSFATVPERMGFMPAGVSPERFHAVAAACVAEIACRGEQAAYNERVDGIDLTGLSLRMP